MNAREKQCIAEDVLEDLAEEASLGVPIIVEGKKDREALRRLGITENIYTVYPSLIDLSERIAKSGARRAVILTDYDRTGRKLAGKLKRLLMNEGIHPDFSYRRKLRFLLKFSFVEELPSLLLKKENR